MDKLYMLAGSGGQKPGPESDRKIKKSPSPRRECFIQRQRSLHHLCECDECGESVRCRH